MNACCVFSWPFEKLTVHRGGLLRHALKCNQALSCVQKGRLDSRRKRTWSVTRRLRDRQGTTIIRSDQPREIVRVALAVAVRMPRFFDRRSDPFTLALALRPRSH